MIATAVVPVVTVVARAVAPAVVRGAVVAAAEVVLRLNFKEIYCLTY